jgi:ATP-dependent helicase/nuclease subunit B
VSLFDRAAPRWFTIPAHRPFLDDLAEGLHAELAAPDPEALADAVVLVPTRRAARALAEAFVRAGEGRALLLPQILALGDLDEGEPPFEPSDLALDLPPAISHMQRRCELARLVLDNAALFERELDAVSALELGDALGGFLDAVQIEEIDPVGKFDGLVDSDFALHWRRSAEVLALATEAWPRRLRALDLVDINQRTTGLLRTLADQWSRRPPDRPLIAAGSTGSASANADLLAVIAGAPRGCVVLPGLDLDLADDAWAQIEGVQGEAHPQGAMKRLLDRAGVSRAEVAPWPSRRTALDDGRGRDRRRLISTALRPPDATADWLRIIGDLKAEGQAAGVDPVARGLDGLTLASARNEEEAATLAALLLRQTLETPARTAALVTPDQAMARRVSARLARWGVEADSSAGRPLATYPQGILMALLARAAAWPLDPATMLAILKHPLARFGADEERLGPVSRVLERYGLRGPKPRDAAEVAARLVTARDRPRSGEPLAPERIADLNDALRLWARVQSAIRVAAAPFEERAAFPVAAEALGRAIEALASDADGRLGDLWAGAGGEAAAAFVAGLIRDGDALEDLSARSFAELIETILAGHLVRTGGANHPRLHILGALEARLVRADLLILAGLEEGVWPRIPPLDPFLSRPMRAALGLPPPERRVGLSAHDFAQAASAPEVVLIATERRDGQPAVKSRWLWRLETLAKGAGAAIPRHPDLDAWAEALDAPLDPRPPTLAAAERPRPKPPLEARPRRLPVTRIETWVRDPYAVYAREILRLRVLDRPDAEMAPWRRGTAIHRAFELLAKADPRPAEPEAWFAARVLEALSDAGFAEPAMARERILSARLAGWAVAFEAERRLANPALLIETEGSHQFEVQGRPFTVTAKADRIEVAAGYAHVLDFKTGQAPSPAQVETGFSPQLTLTAAILMRGGFKGLGAASPGELLYVRAIGRRMAGEVKSAVGKATTALDLAEAAMAGLIRRIARFDDAETPYAAWTAPQFLSQRGGDYDHLSRLYEWHVMGEGEEGGVE